MKPRGEPDRRSGRIGTRSALLLFAIVAILCDPVSGQNPVILSAEDAALIAVARDAVRGAVRGNASAPAVSSRELPARGVFVTIERDGNVIGCRGTLQPRFAGLNAEVRSAARSAAAADPRYRPLTPPDLARFLVTVTVIERLEPIERAEALTLAPTDGLALESGNRTGVVLPYEGRDARIRLGWAYKKAGVPGNSSCRLWRIVARRFRG